MNENNNTQKQGQQQSSIDIKQIFSVVWGLKWWMVLTAVICLSVAFCYTKLIRTKFTANAKIMVVNRDNIGSAEVAVLSDITGVTKTNKVINEAEVLKSTNLMQKVVEQLGLNYTYMKSREFKTIYFDLGQSPFKMLYDGIENNPHPAGMHLTFVPKSETTYQITSLVSGGKEHTFKNPVFSFGESVPFNNTFFIISLNTSAKFVIGDQYEIKTTDAFNTARSLKGGLSVEIGKTMDRSDIVTMRYTDILPTRCEAILDALIFQYNEDAREFSKKATANTLEFLEDRLSFLEQELSSIEGKYQDYRRNNALVNVESQSQLTLTSRERYESQYNEVLLQLELLSMVREYIGKMKGDRSVIPANIGISDPGLNSAINQYNTLLAERNRMAASSSDSNPLVANADTQIADLISSIDASVRNLDKSYQLQKKNLSAKISEDRRKISNIPTQQLALSNFSRQQQIKEPLYILLQQKREEAMISLCSVSDQCKTVDSAHGTASVSSPNKKQIMLLALLLGLCIPPGLFFLRQMLKTTVDGKIDITSRTSLPLLVSIPISEDGDALIQPTGRKAFEEAIRVLRSQFRYFPHKVYQIVSSSPHEGKTFVSANIAASLAHAGKRVLLIGVDLRKPRLHHIFKTEDKAHRIGIVTYLIGRTDNINDIIVKNAAGIQNLDIIYSGSVPPNPAELIESDRMKLFMEQVRNNPDYDYIILDSCPYLSVADTAVMNDYVDANLFVLRTGVTDLRFVTDLNDIAATGKLKNVMIILNAVNYKDRSYGYYYGYGYGRYGYGRYGYGKYGYGYGKYGYGYGYGSEDEGKKKKKSKGSEGSSDSAGDNAEKSETKA